MHAVEVTVVDTYITEVERDKRVRDLAISQAATLRPRFGIHPMPR